MTGIKSADRLPLFQTAVSAAIVQGTRIEFQRAGDLQEVPVPIPCLPGLDELEIERLGFDLLSVEKEDSISVSGQPANGAVPLTYAGAAEAIPRLKRIEITDLRINASPAADFVLLAQNGLAKVLYAWNAASSRTTITPNGPAGAAKQVHLLLRPASGNGFGPPAASAPAFAMPGAGGGMYGPALGGATLSLLNDDAGKINAVLTLTPALSGNRFSLLLGQANPADGAAALPNDVTAISWSAASINAVFDIRPANILIRASAANAGNDQPVVAQFPADPGGIPVAVDFAPVARALLKKAYPNTQGTDLGLRLVFTSGAPGVLQVNLGTAAARYLSRPLEHGPASLQLRGAPESMDLAVAKGLKPSAASLILDGIYGAARLTLDSDTAQPDERHGLRIAGPVRIARRIHLTAAESNLPLTRLGLYGRASEAAELLLTLHQGDALHIGQPIAPPLPLPLAPSHLPAWHRAEYSAPALLPPHPQSLWLVAQSTRGAFWWHGDLEPGDAAQRSEDDGATFTRVPGRPTLHVSVKETNPPPGGPCPLHPLSLFWRDGLLNADVAGVAGCAASLPPKFRRFWIAEGAANSSFFQAIGNLEGVLRLTFACQRDMDLTLSEAIVTYDPWNA